MTYKKFIDNIENIYADQGDKPESERLRYGQIIMMELWNVWPKKYHEIIESDKDPFYCDIMHKKPYDLLSELEKEWPVFPALSEDKVRIQRLEKKIKKLQASNKRHKEDLKYYKRIVRDFPWIEPSVKTMQENIELKKTLKEKNWTIRGLQDALNIAGLISDNNLNQLKGLYEDFKVNGKVLDKYLTSGYEDNLVLLGKIISVISSMKKYTTDVEWRGHEFLKRFL
jgi:predicted RNase H-like nuclease (RuvC/YqgF family)